MGGDGSSGNGEAAAGEEDGASDESPAGEAPTTPRVRVRGIYTTAVTRHLLDAGA